MILLSSAISSKQTVIQYRNSGNKDFLFAFLDITLRGLEVGLLTMRKGELARFLFKPNYAFGTLGCPPLIPPNSTVLFEVELLDFLDSAESDKFFDLPPVSYQIYI